MQIKAALNQRNSPPEAKAKTPTQVVEKTPSPNSGENVPSKKSSIGNQLQTLMSQLEEAKESKEKPKD